MNNNADLPIAPYLKEICSQTKNSPCHFLILTAETAAGKSTAVPPSLLEHFPGKIIMLEPRRLAAISIATRIAATLNESVGKTVGYKVHLENKTCKETRLEIITEAILTRQLQADPSLDGISVVIIDEFHERSIHADLALAFLKEAMALRDDLYVIVMSATIETKRLSAYLGSEENPAPVM
ncbi:MAG: ATP-dependent helicase, partial [Treponema sp.]|nr:ATP-dependent helicase [Treponema sp.]